MTTTNNTKCIFTKDDGSQCTYKKQPNMSYCGYHKNHEPPYPKPDYTIPDSEKNLVPKLVQLVEKLQDEIEELRYDVNKIQYVDY